MGLFLNGNHFYENLFVSTYQRITFRNEQDNNSDDASYQMFFDKIQGLSRTKIDEREFQGLSRP